MIALPETAADRLRRETRLEHDQMERALVWEDRVSKLDLYGLWLRRLHGFYRVWEPAVAATLGDPEFFEPRRKLHLLAADLRCLGISPHEPEVLPLLPVATQAEALGSMYVLEGSTLGSQLVARKVLAHLGFEPHYHSGYGAATGAMWRSFQQKINHDLGDEHLGDAIASARLTLDSLHALLTGARGHGHRSTMDCERRPRTGP